MTIARMQYDGIGARIYTPEGPFGSLGQPPYPGYNRGAQVDGDCESMFVYVFLQILAAQIINQGDLLIWDSSFRAMRSINGAGGFGVGMKGGTFFCGGNPAEVTLSTPPNPVNNYQVNFATPGVYGVWAQRFGCSLVNGVAGIGAGAALSTTAVAGQVQSAAGAVGSYTFAGAYVNPASVSITANTTTGSAVLTNCSSNFGIPQFAQLSGTGIPAGTYVKSVDGPTIVMSQAATATGTGVTVTAAQRVAVGNTTNGSPVLTNVNTIAGIYPNCTITGTGIPASTTIIGISGSPGAYSIVLSQNATATGTGIAFTASGYVEANLADMQITTAN